MPVVDDRFRKFVMGHRDTINGMVAQHWLVVDEQVNKQLQLGFEHCVEPCFLALSRRNDSSCITKERCEESFFSITKLLLVAIKKRFYAFPDKHVVGVDQDTLFDQILPRAIDAGILDGSIDPIVLLFNAGENLREISHAFYDTMLPLLDVIAKYPSDLRTIIHVAAWLAGDAKRRKHAMSILAASQLPPEVLPIVLFKGRIPATNLLDRPIARPLSDVLAVSLANDPWLSPAVISDDPGFAKLIDVASSGKPSIPHDVEQSLAMRAAAKSMKKPGSLKFLGKAGRYEGFGGMFDSPPVVVGSPSEASVIARTSGGRLFHIDYGGTGTITHVIGTVSCDELVCTRHLGLIARHQDGSIVALHEGKVLGTFLQPTGRIIAAGGLEAAFFIDQDANIMYKVVGSGDPMTSHDILFDDTITSLAAITDDRLAIVSCDHDQKKWTLHEVSASGNLTTIAALPGDSLVAACGTYIACLQPDGGLCIVDPSEGTWTTVPIAIDPAKTTSFHVTPREVITTHAFTYAIHFHGPPV